MKTFRIQDGPCAHLLVFAAIGILSSGLAEAQWTYRAGPQPLVRSLSVFPNSPVSGTTTLVASTQTTGFFVSEDAGGSVGTWVSRNAGLPTLRLWAHRTVNVNTIHVATDGGGIYTTTNGGVSWTALNGSGAGALACLTTRSIAVPNSVPTTLYAGTGCTTSSGVWRSVDSGANWTRMGGVVIPVDAQVGSITASADGTIVFAATSRHGLFRSQDSGSTWTAVNTGITGGSAANVFNVAFVGTGTTTLLTYVFGEGIYKSTDSGTTWVASNTGLPDNIAVGGISRESGTTFYIGLDGHGVYKSTNSGDTWAFWGTAGNNAKIFVRSIVADPSIPGKYYLGTLEGVMRTTNSGMSIQSLENFAFQGPVWSITHDWSNPQTAFVLGCSPAKIFDVRGDYDNGVTDLENGLTGNTIGGSIRQDPLDAQRLYLVTANRGVLRSTNGGALWVPASTGLPPMHGQGNVMVIDRNNPQVLYVGLSNGGGVYKSVNGGDTWSAANTGLVTDESRRIRTVSIAGGTGSVIYLATVAGAYKSTDAGGTWSLIYSATDFAGRDLPVNAVRANPSNPTEVFMANTHRNPDGTMVASSGLWKSTNAGANWTQVLPGVLATTVFHEQNGTAYAGIDAAVGQPPLLRSRDGGATWPSFSSGLVGPRVRAGGLDSRGQKLISVSTDSGIHTLPLGTVRSAFNDDAFSDIFWRDNTGGLNYQWQMNGLAITGQGFMPGVPTNWSPVALGDVNGDGRADIFWREIGGLNYLWTMNSLGVETQGFLPSVPGGWVVTGMGDATGDGKADVFWRNATTGDNYFWALDGLNLTGQGYFPNVGGTEWEMAGIADYSGDGKVDALWRNKVTGGNYLWILDGLTITGQGFLPGVPTDWEIVASPNVDSNATADVLWRNKLTGENYAWLMNGLSITSQGFLPPVSDTNWKVVGFGDYNGDGKGDILWRNPATGAVYLWLLDGLTLLGQGFLPNVNGTNWMPVK